MYLRRKGHPLPVSFRPRLPNNQSSRQICSRDTFTTSLPPLAPRPSALHIQAAIALSELGEKRRGDISRCDIGVQTQTVECSSSNKTREGSKRSSCSPGRASASSSSSLRKKQEAETQTKDQKRKCLTVSSQVGMITPDLPPPSCICLTSLLQMIYYAKVSQQCVGSSKRLWCVCLDFF